MFVSGLLFINISLSRLLLHESDQRCRQTFVLQSKSRVSFQKCGEYAPDCAGCWDCVLRCNFLVF